MDENGSIESLTLEINARSESAEKAVDKLISTLERLSNRTANLGLGNIGTQLNGIRRAAAGFGDKEAAGLERILGALDKLKNVSTIKISSSIANQLTNIATAAGNINDTDFSGVERLSNALSGLAGVGQVNIGSALNQLNRIPKIAENLKNIDLADFAARIREITDALRPLAEEMEKVSKGFSAFPDKLQRVLRETEKIPQANKRAADSFGLLAAKVTAGWLAMKKLLSGLLTLVLKSNDFIESQNLFNVAMGQYASEARKYAESVSDALGIDPAEWMENQGLFMTLSTGFGIAGDSAAEMSKNLTQLGYDLSSFYNISSSDAFQKLQSGLSGEIEPLRRLGFDLSHAKLQQIAYSQGIHKNVSEMTQAEKASLRYYAIMTQVTQAQGDMARTIDQPANQLRILRAKTEEAARALGNLLLPIVKIVVPWLIAGAEAVTKFANGLALILGIEGAGDDSFDFSNIIQGAQGQEDAWTGASDAAAEYKRMLLGIDELNVLNGKGGTGGGSGGGYGGGIGGGAGGNLDIPGYGDFLDDLMNGKNITPELDPTSLLLTVRDILVDFEDSSYEQLAQKIITGLGALTGRGIMKYLFKGKGGLIGLGLGAVLSLVLSSLIFDHDGKISRNEFIQTLLPIIGRVAGFAITKSPVGGSIGFAIGTALSLLIENFEFDGETGKLSNGVWGNIKDLIRKVFAGAGIGFILGGPGGAMLGAAIGTVVSLTLSSLGFNGQASPNADLIRKLLPFLGAAGGGLIGFAIGGPAGAAIGATIGVGLGLAVAAIDWEDLGAKYDSFVDNVRSKFDGVSTWITEKTGLTAQDIVSGFTSAYTGVDAAYMVPTQQDFTNLFTWLGEKYTENKDALIQAQMDAFAGQNEQYMVPTQEDFANLFSWMRQSFGDLKTNIITSFNNAKTSVMSNFITPLRTQGSNLANNLRSWFQTTCNNIASAFQTARDRVQAIFGSLASWFSSNVVSPIQNLISSIGGAVSNAISNWSSKLGNIFGGSKKTTNSNPYDNRPDWIKAQGLTFGVFASGGFPDVGQLFVAREQGPELVGRIGNQSAVANNNQIIDGIRQGVYEAMMASNSGGRNGDINLYVSGKQLMTAVAEEARRETVRTGVNPLTQGG